MNEEARKLWRTPAGGSLLAKMLSGEAMAPADQAHLQALKAADPPKMQPPAQPQPPKAPGPT